MAGNAPPGTVTFRKSFHSEDSYTGRIACLIDNEGSVFLNEVKVFDTPADGVSVTVVVGNNEIRVVAKNLGEGPNPGGVLFTLEREGVVVLHPRRPQPDSLGGNPVKLLLGPSMYKVMTLGRSIREGQGHYNVSFASITNDRKENYRKIWWLTCSARCEWVSFFVKCARGSVQLTKKDICSSRVL